MTSSHTEQASAARAVQLDRAVEQTISENLVQSPRGIAHQYQAAYAQYGWQQQGPMTEAATNALTTPANTLQASDGHTYTRSADAQWTTPGTLYGANAAEGNIKHELDATHAAYTRAAAAVSAPQTAPVVDASSTFIRDMTAILDRFDQAIHTGDRAAVMKEVAHVYQTPEWQADYARARVTVAKELEQRERHRAEHPRDPRDAGHPDHAMNQSIRDQVERLHERAGIFISTKELNQLTAGVANHARQQGMTRVDAVQFSGDRSALVATQQSSEHALFSKMSITNVQQAMQAPPEHAYQQMAQETQRQAQSQQNALQQNTLSPQTPSLGR